VTSPDQDRAYFEAGIPELGEYLLSKELYWPISARGYQLPRLTIGGILLAQTRLEARGEHIEGLTMQLDGLRSKWRTAWETKAGREFQSRFGLWNNYLADYRHNPESHADAYPHEVRYRVMLQLLLGELSAPLPERDGLSQLDGLLRANFSPDDFIWEAGIQQGFPREVYWFLYGKLKS
jgi:uncharacterized protein YukE